MTSFELAVIRQDLVDNGQKRVVAQAVLLFLHIFHSQLNSKSPSKRKQELGEPRSPRNQMLSERSPVGPRPSQPASEPCRGGTEGRNHDLTWPGLETCSTQKNSEICMYVPICIEREREGDVCACVYIYMYAYVFIYVYM